MPNHSDLTEAIIARNNLTAILLSRLQPNGSWRSELSGSALATAVASFALAQVDRHQYCRVITSGLDWLAANSNADGGWGDTTSSHSNLSTTLLCWSALAGNADYAEVTAQAEAWLQLRITHLSGASISQAVIDCYGKDHTFSAPILTMAALSGRLGSQHDAWLLVPQLPFELVAFPTWLFKWLNLRVVSYAMPALIAIGLVRHRLGPARHGWHRWIRHRIEPLALRRLQTLQPVNGGFLEAVPLTGFVIMSLAACGYHRHPVVQRGSEFLLASARGDGSWAIDSNLDTWVTSLAVNALGESGLKRLAPPQRWAIGSWLVQQQFQQQHPFTGAAPGGWAWTDLPGGVADADDTAAALVALHLLDRNNQVYRQAARKGVCWLISLQNRDGGIPTFCKGWGRLPFDKSCPDITAHALRAWMLWRDCWPDLRRRMIDQAIVRGQGYLAASQLADGAWSPLWFGNQDAPQAENLTYGTAQVVAALVHLLPLNLPQTRSLWERGHNWLVAAQNKDGGWGGAPGILSSVEETALALAALASNEAPARTITAGVRWLCRQTDYGRHLPPATPIGLYFASLWYWEKLYPLLFSLWAFTSAAVIR